MSDGVKRRSYDSPRRREQAAATRRDILDAAQALFAERGYAATTMEAIARAADVSNKTVYVVFETKAGVLRGLWNHLLRAGRDEVPVAEQPWYRAVIEEPDAERQIRLTAANSKNAKLRIAGVLEVIRTAAPIDPDIGALWKRIQTEFHANQRVVVESVAAKGALHPGLDVDRAADILWTIHHPALWQLLVDERGWTPEQYEQWCADLACAQLLSPR
jgi:AcrR family transcriptional regulator